MNTWLPDALMMVLVPVGILVCVGVPVWMLVLLIGDERGWW